MVAIAERYEHVVGIDTHARTHTYCIIESRTGSMVDTRSFPTTVPGMRRAVSWIRRRTLGTALLAAVEGTSSYGAGITTALLAEGIEVAEIRALYRRARARTGKSDPLDAEAAARTALSTDVEKLAHPRRSGDRAALRVLLASRSLTDQQRTANKNALTALLRTTDVGVDARKPLTDAQIATIAAWRTGRDEPSYRVFREEGRRLAKTIIEQTRSLQQNHRRCRCSPRALPRASRAFLGSVRSQERSWWRRTHTTDGCAPKRLSPRSEALPRCRPPRATPAAIDSPGRATGSSTAPSTSSSARG